MTARGTVFLLAVLAALLGYLWVFEIHPRAPAGPPPAPPLLSVPFANVARVELRDRDRTLTALRSAAGWTDPAGRPWVAGTVTDLIETLGSLRPVMVVDPAPREPADYGFGRDARRLELVTGDGQAALALELGERNPAWTGLYARRAGRPEVLLVGAVLGWELEKLRAAAP